MATLRSLLPKPLAKSASGWAARNAPGAIHFNHKIHGTVSVLDHGNNQFSVKHNGAMAGLKGVKPTFTDRSTALQHAKAYISALHTGTTAGKHMQNIPSAGGMAKQAEPLLKPYVSDAQRRWAHTATGTKALGGKQAVNHWDQATKGKKLPERVGKAEEYFQSLAKSKNVRAQRKAVFGTRGDPGKNSKAGKKQIAALSDLAQKRYGMTVKPSKGKIDMATGGRKDFDPNQVGGKLKPDWRSGDLESQMNPQAISHELGHLEQAPEGHSMGQIQEGMDQEYRTLASKYGARQKQTEAEIQPMAAENPLRRRAGVPAFARPQTTDPRMGHGKNPIKEGTPERTSLDTGRQYAQRVTDPKTGEKQDLIAQSRNLTPENRTRMNQVDHGIMVFDPKAGWRLSNSSDSLINLRSMGHAKTATSLLRDKYLKKPKEDEHGQLEMPLAASEKDS